ncbi:hypothetical protein Tfont_02731 [Tepidimonas fonticaldi]|uniref:Uncharacterized protein n=1 Tax=Tepidimonas fonticaldi TaxID=1101373 RepID=A0A554XEJ1_9BURK|nr:hypothetical protein [Tepidimonas fonticaldi]TSE34209.1 hypothetical protein Tfont_02731 [Tepidimonas fonticaldi]
MTKPARCTDPRRAQRGDALLEALVGILLLALLGLGLSYAAARMLAAQRYAAAHGIVVAQMRNALETQGIAHLCSNPHTFSFTPVGGSAVSVELPAAHCEKHDVAISTGGALSVTLPQAAVTRMVFSTQDTDTDSARELLGPGSIVLSQ